MNTIMKVTDALKDFVNEVERRFRNEVRPGVLKTKITKDFFSYSPGELILITGDPSSLVSPISFIMNELVDICINQSVPTCILGSRSKQYYLEKTISIVSEVPENSLKSGLLSTENFKTFKKCITELYENAPLTISEVSPSTLGNLIACMEEALRRENNTKIFFLDNMAWLYNLKSGRKDYSKALFKLKSFAYEHDVIVITNYIPNNIDPKTDFKEASLEDLFSSNPEFVHHTDSILCVYDKEEGVAGLSTTISIDIDVLKDRDEEGVYKPFFFYHPGTGKITTSLENEEE